MNRQAIEVSVVLPCLNEEQTLAACIGAARKVLDGAEIEGEIVVADNGSTDRSREIAIDQGARVVEARHPGYGSALQTGLTGAEGRFMVFLDADLSYGFGDIPRFVEELRAGADLVIGSRFRGAIDTGAMPVLHRILGTPALTRLANLLFGCGITDINCGMRGLTKPALERLDLHSEGMEYASEMMIKAARNDLRVTEIPIDFHVDGRGREPHLRSFRDGWRHLQLMLHYCSLWLFLAPGLLLTVGGVAAILLNPWGLFTYLAAQSATTVGIMILLLGLTAQGRVKASKYARWRDKRLRRIVRNWLKLEQGMLVGFAMIVAGAMATAYGAWSILGIANAEEPIPVAFDDVNIKLALLGATLFIGGLQVFFASLFMGLFGIRVADDAPEP